MIKVEISSGMASVFGAKDMSEAILEIEARGPMTVDDVLRQIARRYEIFKKIAFDANSQKFNGIVLIVLNGRLLQMPGELETRLENNDILIIFPPYTGG